MMLCRCWMTVYDESFDLAGAENLVYVRNNMEHSRVIYDVTQDMWEEFHSILGKYTSKYGLVVNTSNYDFRFVKRNMNIAEQHRKLMKNFFFE